MTDLTREQGAELGTDPLVLMINLMARNRAENEAIRVSLYESVQRDLDRARAEIARIRRNVSIVLSRPHTDAMVANAVTAGYDYDDPEATA